MATVIFDFDSTLITCESLEEVLKAKHIDNDLTKKIQNITNQGMSGEITFLDSLQKRLGLVSVSKKDFLDFGKKADGYLTLGMKGLIGELLEKGVEVWIISGALKNILIPFGKKLGIDKSKVLGIDLDWDVDGKYVGIDIEKSINRSKWEGAKQVSSNWSLPRIAVGDGMTDFALYEHGQVDHFIAFTENVRRQALLDKGVPEANSVAELRLILKELLDGNAFLSKK